MKFSHPLWKLSPFFSQKIWGWEKWLFSIHPNGHATLQNGPHKGLPLIEALKQTNKEASSSACSPLPLSIPPVLIKLIQAEQDLSVQVHPNDGYAKLHGQSRGKSECWLFLEHSPDAKVIRGFTSSIRTYTPPTPENTDDIRKLFINTNDTTIQKNLETLTVQRGAALYIPAGTVHAIGGGIKLLEIQQSSDITYRLYDYGRSRETHLEHALAVMNRTATGTFYPPADATYIKTPYFQIKQHILTPYEKVTIAFSSPSSKQQTILVVLSGKFQIKHEATDGKQILNAQEEDCFYAPSGGEFEIKNLGVPSRYVQIVAFDDIS